MDDPCKAFFDPDLNSILVCSGTANLLRQRIEDRTCPRVVGGYVWSDTMLTYMNGSKALEDRCADGGFDSKVAYWTKGSLNDGASQARAVSACDYGTQCKTCGGGRPRVVDFQSTSDVCKVEEKDGKGPCLDGGVNSKGNKCGYGTQYTRCGKRSVIVQSIDPLVGGFFTRRLAESAPAPASSVTNLDRCECLCFSGGEGGQWSEQELHVRATFYQPAGVLYAARPILTRGPAFPFKGWTWVGLHPRSLWLPSPAFAGSLAHLVTGFRSSKTPLGPSPIPLVAYQGMAPHAWTGTGLAHDFLMQEQNATTDPTFWADVCAAACVRRFRDSVQLVEVDLTPPLRNASGDRTDAHAHPGTCRCFAIDNSSVGASSVAPGDLSIVRWLQGARREPTVAHRPSLRLYAIHHQPTNWYFSESWQSTVYYSTVYVSGYVLDFDVIGLEVGVGVGVRRIDALDASSTPERCLEACLKASAEDASFHLGGVQVAPCVCMAFDPGESRFDGAWHYDASLGGSRRTYSVRVCHGVRGASDASVVYVKSRGEFCPGVPVDAGAVLPAQSILTSVDAGEDDVPFDLRCKALCDEVDECGLAQVAVETFAHHQRIHAFPPPPSPPAAPSPPRPPPPNVPPLPPFPPTSPLEAGAGRVDPYRLWSPAENQAPGTSSSVHQSKVNRFSITCGLPSCRTEHIPVFSSSSQLLVAERAREMQRQKVYQKSLCPYECEHDVFSHALSDLMEGMVVTGHGLVAEGLHYPGRDGGGLSAFAVAKDARPLRPVHTKHDVTMNACAKSFERHKLVVMHGLWVENATSSSGAVVTGDCLFFLVARTPMQTTLWRAFFAYARSILRLGHYEDNFPSEVDTARIVPSRSERCRKTGIVGERSRVCLFWSEVAVGDHLSCFPKDNLTNVLTPPIILAALARGRIAYPPPAPPPPPEEEEEEEEEEEDQHFNCTREALPNTQHRRIVHDELPTLWAPLQCWRWNSAARWPPFGVHRDVYHPVPECGNLASREVLWKDGARQPHIAPEHYDRFHLSTSTCPRRGTPPSRKKAEPNQCSDGTDPTKRDNIDLGCDLGTDLENCNVIDDLVIFGYSNDKSCNVEPANSPNSQGKCRDGGPGSYSAVCSYGTDTDRCGVRRFAFDERSAGPTSPDDSCEEYANNSKCEDGLMFAEPGQVPGDSRCPPNTDRTDCGYRRPAPTVYVGLAQESTCSRASYTRCADLSDYMGSDGGSTALSSCGRGTAAHSCQYVADKELAGATEGSWEFLQKAYLPKHIYVSVEGNTQPCVAPENLVNASSIADLCSDGGEASFRLPLRVPANGKIIHDFACPYGSQSPDVDARGPCPRRGALQSSREFADAVQIPRGPQMVECAAAPPSQCCKLEHYFSVTGGDHCPVGGTTTTTGNTSCSIANGSAAYFTQPTGCEASCMAIARSGNDDDCLPINPECANYVGPTAFPHLPTTVGTWCLCGPMERSLVELGTAFSRRKRRALQEAEWDWEEEPWDGQPIGAIRAEHGAHLDASATCLVDLMTFVSDGLKDGATECGGYFALESPPSDARLLCDADTPVGACCVAPKGSADASRVYLHTTDDQGAAHQLRQSHHVGLGAYGTEGATYGNFNDDEFPDLVIGNRLFLNSGNGDFSHQEGILIGSTAVKACYAGDVDGMPPDDLVFVYPNNEVEIFLSVFDPDALPASGGVGFVSAGVVMQAHAAIISTVNFIGTHEGYGTNCRGVDFGCVSNRRAVFVGTENTDDMVFVSDEDASPSAPYALEQFPGSCSRTTHLELRTFQGCLLAARALGFDDPPDTDALPSQARLLHQNRCYTTREGMQNYYRTTTRFAPYPNKKGNGLLCQRLPSANSFERGVRFTPVANSKHRTLSSARFFLDLGRRRQALAIGTGAESPNSMAYLAIPGFTPHALGSAAGEESGSVTTARIGDDANLICFGNRNAADRCHRFAVNSRKQQRNNQISSDMSRTRERRLAAAAGVGQCRYRLPNQVEPFDGYYFDEVAPRSGTYFNPIMRTSQFAMAECEARCDAAPSCDYFVYTRGCESTATDVYAKARLCSSKSLCNWIPPRKDAWSNELFIRVEDETGSLNGQLRHADQQGMEIVEFANNGVFANSGPCAMSALKFKSLEVLPYTPNVSRLVHPERGYGPYCEGSSDGSHSFNVEVTVRLYKKESREHRGRCLLGKKKGSTFQKLYTVVAEMKYACATDATYAHGELEECLEEVPKTSHVVGPSDRVTSAIRLAYLDADQHIDLLVSVEGGGG